MLSAVVHTRLNKRLATVPENSLRVFPGRPDVSAGFTVAAVDVVAVLDGRD
jgi:hypothetical protein